MNVYVLCFCVSALVTALSILPLNRVLGRFLTDLPGGLKQHKKPTLLTGGTAVFLGTAAALVLVRFVTNFPTGTLHALRGVLGASFLIFLLGFLDDLRKPKGLSIAVRLAVQTVAAGILIYYGVHVQIFARPQFNYLFTFLWLVGVTNAFNLLDIADGLCVSQAVVCTLGLFLIAWPGEMAYVNFAALALLGACLAFWPHNHSKYKLFLGDSGATFLGFFIAALTMGAQYSRTNPYGFIAPLLIAAVPLLDTAYVTLVRLLKHKNPLKGSNDHLALRLKNRFHLPNHMILTLFTLTALGCNILAYICTQIRAVHTPPFGVLCALGAVMGLLWLLQKLHTSKR